MSKHSEAIAHLKALEEYCADRWDEECDQCVFWLKNKKCCGMIAVITDGENYPDIWNEIKYENLKEREKWDAEIEEDVKMLEQEEQ